MSVYATDLDLSKLLVCHDIVNNQTLRITAYAEIELEGVKLYDQGTSAILTREEAEKVFESIRKFLRSCPTCGHLRGYGEPR